MVCRMLSCQAVTIGRDVRGVASLAWGGVRGTGGDWSVIDHAAQPLPTPPLSLPRTCPSSMLYYTVDYMTGRGTVNIAVKTAWEIHCSGVQRDSLGDPLFATREQSRRRASDSAETPPIDLLELEELT